MGMSLENMSTNLVLVMQEIVSNQTICKYLNYNKTNPLSQSDLVLPANSLIRTKVFPYPSDISLLTDDVSQLMIYYPKGDFTSNHVIENTDIYFDIIVAKNLWLVNDSSPLVRPYEIMKHIMNHFKDKSVSTVGKLKFKRFGHLSINQKFDGVRLIGEMFTTGDR